MLPSIRASTLELYEEDGVQLSLRKSRATVPVSKIMRKSMPFRIVEFACIIFRFKAISYGPLLSEGIWTMGPQFEGGLKWCCNGFMRIPSYRPMKRDHGIYVESMVARFWSQVPDRFWWQGRLPVCSWYFPREKWLPFTPGRVVKPSSDGH